ncbi:MULTISPECIES: M16 family metallopeptidase [unclassified Moraxella]|uniref:M16 family metallopeptidase n=1 Tax=unclassified Moraxella TaxID=2685852 RepID=UPI003AF95D76
MQNPTFTPRQFILRLALSLMAISMLPNAYADTANSQAETHGSADIDPNAPILALDKLDSLKNTPPLTVTLPTIQHFHTDNGTPVAFVQANNLPMVDISLYFNAGSARDETIKKGGFGIASLTASLLDQGTRQLSEDQIAEISEQLGISLGANAYKDMFSVSLRSLSDAKYLNPAVTLMSDIISQPTFPKANLERTKAQYLVGLQQAKEDPDTIASRAFAKAIFGKHPYAHPSTGTEASIPQIQSADLQRFAKRYLVAKNANIAITGDLSLTQAKAIANQLTAQLPKGTPAPALPEPTPLKTAKTIHIPFDSTQTSVVMGQLGDKRQTDATTLQRQTNFALANEIVGGGGFQARLMSEIRKKRGLTYGIYSGLTPMQATGAYRIEFSTRNEKAEEAIKATLDVVKSVKQQGVTQTELDLTKDSQINSFPLTFASNASINSTLGMMGFYGLPDSYLSDYVNRVKQADLNQVNHAYATLIDPNRFVIVTVGKKQP